MINQYKILGNWEKVADKFNNKYSSHVISSRVREYLEEDKYKKLIKNFKTKGSKQAVFISDNKLDQIILEYKKIGSWDKIAQKFKYSRVVIKDRIIKYIGFEKYQKLVKMYSSSPTINPISTRVSKKILLEKKQLRKIIRRYKILGSWEKVANEFKLSYDTTRRRVFEYLGDRKYHKLIKKYSNQGKPPDRRVDIPINILKEIIADYGRHQSWERIADEYDEYSADIIRTRIIEIIGENGYKKLIKKEVQGNLYTNLFFNEEYRVHNAWLQVFKRIGKNKLIQINQEIVPHNWNDFFEFLRENLQWKFVDILTGEIIGRKDFIDFHHNDRNKKKDSMLNLWFILHQNHGIITTAQRSWKVLSDFFQNLILENYVEILEGNIPESWIYNWKVLALDKGINIPIDQYDRNGTMNKKFAEYWQRSLTDF